jgi:hypothetical protein
MAQDLSSLIGITSGSAMLNDFFFFVQLFVAIGIVGYAGWFFIYRPKQFKDIIEVWDITDAGIVRHMDRGRWKENKVDGTGEYRLLKDKKARLNQPPLSAAVADKRGRYKYLLIRNGESGYDYAVLPQSDWSKEGLPIPLPLSDTDWAKHSIKKAAEKKTLSGFWNENKGMIMFTTAAVLTLVLVYWTIGFAADTASSISSAAGQQAEALNEIANSLQGVANQLSGSSGAGNTGVAPPPGF